MTEKKMSVFDAQAAIETWLLIPESPSVAYEALAALKGTPYYDENRDSVAIVLQKSGNEIDAAVNRAEIKNNAVNRSLERKKPSFDSCGVIESWLRDPGQDINPVIDALADLKKNNGHNYEEYLYEVSVAGALSEKRLDERVQRRLDRLNGKNNRYDYRLAPTARNSLYVGTHCRDCGKELGSYDKRYKIPTSAWVVFVILLFCAFPICWLPLVLMKEEVRRDYCINCDRRK